MRKIFLLLMMIFLVSSLNLSEVFGINNLDKPQNPIAYSSGTSIFIEWSYLYIGIGTVYFEIYEWDRTSWKLKDDTIKYPTLKKTFTGQSVGRHIYRIRAKEILLFSTNYSAYTNNFESYVLTTPTGVKVENVSLKYDLKISWNPVDINADRIEIRRNTIPGPDFPSVIATIDKSLTTYTDTTVLPNTTYVYYIGLIKFDETGSKNDYTIMTTGVSQKTYPKGVSNISGSAQGDYVYLSWLYIDYPSGTTVSGFKIYELIKIIPSPPLPPTPIELPNLILTLPNTTSVATITGVSPGAHKYQVRPYNSAGESFDNLNLTVYALKTPTNLTITPLSSNSIKLNWDNIDSNATSIIVTRSLDGLVFTSLVSLSITNTSFLDSSCLPDTKYWYKIKAKRDLNESYFSNVATTKTLPLGSPPAAPSNLQGTHINCNQINITWQDNSTDETNFIIDRKTEGGSYSVRATLTANQTSYSDSTVSANTKYYYRVKARNSYGDSSYSNEINITTPPCGTPPNAPTNLTLTVISSTQINLNWTDNSNNESGFKIERKVEGGLYSEISSVSANVTSYNDTSLLPNTKYYYKVIAYNTYGQSSSNEASETTQPAGTPPSAPSNLNTNVLSCNQIKLTWIDNSINESGFRIERKEGAGVYDILDTVGPDIIFYIDNTALENKTYTYRILAFNEYGENSSNEKTAITPLCGTIPNAPINLILIVLSPTQIKIMFNDNSDNEDGFKIERKELGGTYIEIKTLPPNSTEFNDNVNPNTTYYYRVRSFNTYGYSLYSNEANATTPKIDVPPNPPSNLIASASSCNEVNLLWQDNSDNEDGFRIERKEEGGTYLLIKTLSSNATIFNDTTVTGNKKYYYRIYAFNSFGLSTFSNEFIVNTPECGIKPNSPTNLLAQAISKSEISLTWKDNSDNEDGFIIERKEEGGVYVTITTLPKDSIKYTDKNLVSDKTYYYRIKSYNSFGESNYSNEISAKTQKDLEIIILRFYIGKIIYYLNDEMKSMDVAPMILEGRTLLPIRYVAEALGANVGWDAKEQKVTINFRETVIELWIGKSIATVNGEKRFIDPINSNVKPITIPPGRTMLPIRFIAENLGCQVDWNSNLKEVKITYSVR